MTATASASAGADVLASGLWLADRARQLGHGDGDADLVGAVRELLPHATDDAELLAMIAAALAQLDGDAADEAERHAVAVEVVAEARGGRGGYRADGPRPLDLWGDSTLTGDATLDPGLVPSDVGGMAADEAERLGVDLAQIVMPAMTVCVATIHDSHHIQPRRADTGWTESARLWLVLIQPPGGKKSPSLARVVAPLRAIERSWSVDDALTFARYQADAKRYAKDVERYARREIDEPPEEPRRPPMRRRIVSDATPEALSDIASDNPSGVLAIFGEMVTWLASHDCYRDRGGGGRDRSLWLELYDGGPQIIDRVRRGHVHVANWSASILGGIQPGPLRRLLGKITDDGLVQRLIPVWTDPPTDGVDREPNHRAGLAYDNLIRRLIDLPIGAEPYRLSEAAHVERQIVAQTARHVMVLPTTSDAMRGAFAKWEGLFARLLLTWHLAEHHNPPPVVSGETAGRVARLMVSYLLPQTARLYAELGGGGSADHAKWIAGWILAHRRDVVSTRDIGRACRELRGDHVAIGAAMDTLTLAAWVTPADDQRPGAPLRRWRVLPAVHQVFAQRAGAERQRRVAVAQRIGEAARALGISDDDPEEVEE